MRTLLLAVLLGTGSLLSAATPRPNIAGVVLDAKGRPLAGVTVMVYHAGVKVGYSTFCPSCYVDCGRRAITDSKGAFVIKGVAPDLWFTLLAAGDGYVPTVSEPVDPIKVPDVALKLTAKERTADFSGTVRGRVIEADGTPVADAIILPIGFIDRDRGSTYGVVPGLQPLSVSNKQGEFDIAYSKATPKMLLEVEARALAPKFVVMDTGRERHAIALSDGAAIAGRLVQNGKPVPNAQIGLIAKNRSVLGLDLRLTGNPYDVVRVGTDANGRFTLPNVPIGVDWYIYPIMESISALGAADPLEVRTHKDGEYLQTPDLVIKPGFHVRGNVVASDRKGIAEGMRVRLDSDTRFDYQNVRLAADGYFEFNNVPAGKYTIDASVKCYHEKMSQDGPPPFVVERDIQNFTVTIYPDVR